MHTAIITDSDDSRVNECGLTMNHVYSILDVFTLHDPVFGAIDHRLLIIRDPRANLQQTESNQKWNSDDWASWSQKNYR